MEKKDREVKDGCIEKLVKLNRVAKVVKGGRRFSFSALVVVGYGDGRVGYGFGKANDVTDAIRKATDKAKAHLITVPLKGSTIPHDITGKFKSASVLLRPAVPGTGVKAVLVLRLVELFVLFAMQQESGIFFPSPSVQEMELTQLRQHSMLSSICMMQQLWQKAEARL